MWPADHTCCVATEIDDDSTIIGGATELISELCAAAAIEGPAHRTPRAFRRRSQPPI
jgi:hypothetical protein